MWINMNCNSKQSACKSELPKISVSKTKENFSKLTPKQRHWTINSSSSTYQGFVIKVNLKLYQPF